MSTFKGWRQKCGWGAALSRLPVFASCGIALETSIREGGPAVRISFPPPRGLSHQRLAWLQAQSPHPGMHAAHRAADDQTQMGDIEALGDQLIARFDHVIVPVVWKVPLKPVRGLARSAAPDRVRHDDEVLRRIERL